MREIVNALSTKNLPNLILMLSLLAASVWDIRERRVWIGTTIPAAAARILIQLLQADSRGQMLQSALRGILWDSLWTGLFLVFLLVCSKLTRGGIGDGDIWLLGGILVTMGVVNGIVVFALALLLAAVLSLMLIVLRRANRRTRLPFVPFLAAAVMACCILE